MGAGRLAVFGFLQVVGQDDGGDPALADGDADRPVDQMAHLRRRAGLLDEGAGDVLEHRRQVQFLLVMPAQGGKRLLAGDGEHRHMVHARIVEAGQQVRGAGAGGGDADAQAATELGIGGGHERRHFLMAGLDEPDLAVGPVERAEHTIDAIARIAVDAPHAPLVQAFNKKVADRHRHGNLV